MLIVLSSSVNLLHFALHILKDEYPGNAAISDSTFDAVALCISLGGTAFINIYYIHPHVNTIWIEIDNITDACIGDFELGGQGGHCSWWPVSGWWPSPRVNPT